MGHGVQIALDCGFRKVLSVDIEEKYVTINKERFMNNKNVQIYLGDSRNVLKEICPKILEKTTFWLDGHSFYNIPLIEEVRSIGLSPYKEHIILVDDCRMFGTESWSFLKKQDVIEEILKVNPNYHIHYENSISGPNDILVAEIK